MNELNPTSPVARRGLMLVLSSPSGAGKTTLSRLLLETDPGVVMSVSVTTRKPRPGEQHGVDYFFVTTPEFMAMRENNDLLEWAEVFGHYYATPRAAVEKALNIGCDVLFDIDWQGTQQLVDHMREDMVRVFILPPSAIELEARLQSRAQDPPEIVAGRMAAASNEISHWAEYDYVLINDDLERCSRAISSILHAERLKRSRRSGLSDFVRALQKDL